MPFSFYARRFRSFGQYKPTFLFLFSSSHPGRKEHRSCCDEIVFSKPRRARRTIKYYIDATLTHVYIHTHLRTYTHTHAYSWRDPHALGRFIVYPRKTAASSAFHLSPALGVKLSFALVDRASLLYVRFNKEGAIHSGLKSVEVMQKAIYNRIYPLFNCNCARGWRSRQKNISHSFTLFLSFISCRKRVSLVDCV